MEEHKYPIYHFKYCWDEDGCENNRMGYDHMFRKDPGLEGAMLRAFLDFLEYIGAVRTREPNKGKRLIDLNARNVRIEVRLRFHETWRGGWFCHDTFNTHLSDDELRASFDQFVERMLPLTLKEPPEYCLMGAEERWRWQGPCRCKHCQANGRVRIDH